MEENNKIKQESNGKSFWRPGNIIILSVLAVIFIAAIYYIFLGIGSPSLTVDPVHQQCINNNDCVMVATQCSCDCGTPVHKQYEEYYDSKVQKKCENYRGMLCSMACNYKLT